MKHRVVLFVSLLGLLALVLPGAAVAGDEDASPEEVAQWLLNGESQDVLRAAKIMQGASTSFLYDVAMALRELRGPVVTRPPVPPREIPPLRLPPGFAPPPPPRPLPVIAQPDETMVLVETEIWSMSRDGPGGLVQGGLPGMVQHLDTLEVEALRRALERSEGARVLSAPSIVVLHGEEGRIQVGEEVTYVKNVRVNREGGAVTAEPVLATIHEGYSLEVAPRVHVDRTEVNLAITYEGTAIQRPIQKRPVTVEGLDEPFEVQTPEVSVTSRSAAVNVPRNGAVLLGGLDDPADHERTLILVIKATVLDVTPAPALPPGGPSAPPPLPMPVPPPSGEATTAISLEARILQVTEAAVARALPNGRPSQAEPVRILDAEEVVGLLGVGRKGAEGVQIMTSPRITTYSGQMANVSMLKQISFVQDFDIEVGMGGVRAADPIIGVLQEGIVFELTPTLRSGPTPIHLDLNATWSDIKRPIEEFTTRLYEGGPEVTIQLPEMLVSQLMGAIDTAPGAYVLFGGFTPTPEGSHRLILVRASLVELPEPANPWVPGKPGEVTPR